MFICDNIREELKKANNYLQQEWYQHADSRLDLAQKSLGRLQHNVVMSFFYPRFISSTETELKSLRVRVVEQGAIGELERARAAILDHKFISYKKASTLLGILEGYYKKANLPLPDEFYEVGKQIFDAQAPVYIQYIQEAVAESNLESAASLLTLLERDAKHAAEQLPEKAVALKERLLAQSGKK